MTTFNLSNAQWSAAKAEIRDILIARARERSLIPYSDLVRRVQSVRLEPHDIRLFHLLGDVSADEDAAGRGMLSVLVVHKDGDMQPGPGFFELAEQLGRDTDDILKCWVDELKSVWRAWQD